MTVVLPAPVASFSARRDELRVGVVVRVGEVLEEALARLAELRRDLGQPDRRLDRLDLAEERADAAELVMAPVLEQPRRLGRDLPVVRVRELAPRVDVAAQLVDDRASGRTAAPRSRAPCPRRRRSPAASACRLRFFGFGIGVMNSARRRRSMILLRRLAVVVELPVARPGTRRASSGSAARRTWGLCSPAGLSSGGSRPAWTVVWTRDYFDRGALGSARERGADFPPSGFRNVDACPLGRTRFPRAHGMAGPRPPSRIRGSSRASECITALRAASGPRRLSTEVQVLHPDTMGTFAGRCRSRLHRTRTHTERSEGRR